MVEGPRMQPEELGGERSTNGIDKNDACGPDSHSHLPKHVRVDQVRAETENSGENREDPTSPVVRALTEQAEELVSKLSSACPGVSLVRPFEGSARYEPRSSSYRGRGISPFWDMLLSRRC